MDGASFFAAGLSTASFLGAGVVAISYFKEKYAQKGVISDATKTAGQALAEAQAAIKIACEVRDTLCQEAIAKAGIAKAKAESATLEAEAVAESLSALNAKFTARTLAEAKRNRTATRAARGAEGGSEADGEEEEEIPIRKSRKLSQEDLFAQALEENRRQSGETGGEDHQNGRPDINEVRRRDPSQIRLRRK